MQRKGNALPVENLFNNEVMNKFSLAMMTATLMLAACQAGTQQENNAGTPIGKANISIPGKRMTPEALWAMGRIGGISVSPGGEQLAYTVTYYSVEQNKSNTEIFVMNADGSGNRQITRTAFSENSPAWTKGGSRIAFLSNESGSSQIWEMAPDGTEKKQLTDREGGIDGFLFSPDGTKVLFIAQVKTVKATAEKNPDLPQASGIIVDDLMYKHWDEWVATAPHPFVADFNGEAISNVKDILEGEPYEAPMKPFGGIEQLAWSPDGKQVAYTSRKKTGKAYALSTNSDIYLYNLEDGSTRNLSEGNMGYDTNPQFSPDGRFIAWQSMERDGYESDRNRLCVLDLAQGTRQYVTESFDSNVDQFVWNHDSRSLYFTGTWHGTTQVYHVTLEDSKHIGQVTTGLYDHGSIALCGNDKLIATRHSMSQADEICLIEGLGSRPAPACAFLTNPHYTTDSSNDAANAPFPVRQLTHENQHIYSQMEMGRVEGRWLKTTDGKDMLTWIIYPPQFDPKKKYPALLYCEGGPQSPLSQFWSYRWNFQMMAANDYVIVAPCRRGMPGFGSAWNEEISGDYGGQCMKDLLTAIDQVSQEPFIDKERLGCVGASFGGFTVYWMAGHHEGRFKAFIAHDGIFNMEMQYLETEEKWFANWDMGGAYWEKANTTAQRTFLNSPHRFVDRWDTPILCIHGERDYRILANQAMAAFDAAQLRGIPSELLIFPDENHWVLKPQNGILWQRTFFAWLDRWLKPAK